MGLGTKETEERTWRETVKPQAPTKATGTTARKETARRNKEK